MSSRGGGGLTHAHLDFCTTKLQERVVKFVLENKGATYKEIADGAGLTEASVQKMMWRLKHRAAVQGVAPDHHMTEEVPEPFHVKGVSTAYKVKEDGTKVPTYQWVKSDLKAAKLKQVAEEIAASLMEDLPRVKPRKATSQSYSKELLSVIPFGDPHFGMHAWGEETGDDFDLKIAERDLCTAVDRLIHTSPATDQLLIANLGDFFHADNLQGVTSRSGHPLDTDTRWPKVLRVGIKAMRQCIESGLDNHKQVHVINAIGNHDDQTSMMLSVALANVYEKEKRVNIVDTPTAIHKFVFGQNLVVVTHGHGIKMNQLPLLAATEFPQEWGNTSHRIGLTGHVHHDQLKEFNGMTVESARTLSARDAYAASHGYKSLRDMKCLVLHKEYGEVERHRVTPNML
jgi:hypothetical protein